MIGSPIRRSLGAAVTLGALVGAAPVVAQRDSTRRDSVTVLAPLQVTAERERAAPPPVAATAIDALTFRRTNATNPYLALRQVAGIEVHDQGQGPGFASNVVLRGFTSDHSSDILLVIDGVPVNLPAHGHIEGYADWNVLLPRAVSSLRVIHGGASPLYGDFALGGAVEVFTRADKEGFDGAIGGTSFGDLRIEADAGRRGETGGFYVGGGFRRERGWRPNSDYGLGTGLIRGWTQAGGGRLEGGLSLYATSWDSPGFVDVPTFNVPNFDRISDSTDGGTSRRVVVHGRYAVPLSSTGFLQAVGWGMAADYDLFLTIPGHNHGGAPGVVIQSGEHDDRWGAGGQVEGVWFLPVGELLIGVSGRADRVGYTHAATFERAVIASELDLDARHAAGAWYGRLRRTVAGKLGVDLGLRWDVLGHRSRSRLPGSTGWESSTVGVVSPKLGARYAVGGPWSLRASAARGFRSAVGIIGDPTREPYLAWSYEAGVDHHGDRAQVEVSLFRVDVSNERVQDPVTLAISGAGASRRQGVDASAAFRLGERSTVQLRATYNHARLSAPYADAHDDHPHTVFSTPGTAGLVEGRYARHVPLVSEYQAFGRLATPVGRRVEAWGSVRVQGPHVPVGETSVRTQPYHVADVGATVRLQPGLELDLEVANLTDTRFVELRSSGFVTPGTPRSVRAQVRWSSLRP